jgi:hypothetical protein
VNKITFKTAQFNYYSQGNPLMPENPKFTRYIRISGKSEETQNPKFKSQNSKVKNQKSKVKSQNPKVKIQNSKFKIEPTPKSPINWILSGVEGCKHLLIRTLRLRSVSGFL